MAYLSITAATYLITYFNFLHSLLSCSVDSSNLHELALEI